LYVQVDDDSSVEDKLREGTSGAEDSAAAAPPSKLARGKIISRYNITYT
jgi:hypothetical protein